MTVRSNQSMEGNSLVLSNLHIDGAGAGTSNVRELRNFTRELGSRHGANQVIIRGGERTTGASPGHTPREIIIKVPQ